VISIFLRPSDAFTTIEVRDFPPQDWAKIQKAKERIWKDIHAEKVFSVFSTDSSRLYSLGLVKLDRMENIYVLDYGDVSVKKFSPGGRLLKTFGNGRGRGPGQFINPTDFTVDSESRVFICDPKTAAVSVFSGDGSLQKTHSLSGAPYRICFIREGAFITELVGVTNHWFEMYDTNGNLISSFGKNIIPGESKFPILLAGSLASDGQSLLHAFSRLGCFFSFSLTARELGFAAKTIDTLPPPRIKVSRDRKAMWIDKSSPVSVTSISVDDTSIFTSCGSPPNGEHSTIDVYSIRDGSYLYSFRIPERTKAASVSKRVFCGITDTSISKWEIRLNQ